MKHHPAGAIFCVRPANERRRYIVTSSLIGWAHTKWSLPWIHYCRPDIIRFNIAIYSHVWISTSCKLIWKKLKIDPNSLLLPVRSKTVSLNQFICCCFTDFNAQVNLQPCLTRKLMKETENRSKQSPLTGSIQNRTRMVQGHRGHNPT